MRLLPKTRLRGSYVRGMIYESVCELFENGEVGVNAYREEHFLTIVINDPSDLPNFFTRTASVADDVLDVHNTRREQR